MSIKYYAHVTGRINGHQIKIEGAGDIIELQGLTSGRYDLLQWPRSIDPLFLSCCLITGYPNVSSSEFISVENPFQNTNYQYQRSISFSTGESLHLNTSVTKDRNRLNSIFEINGFCPMESLKKTSPLIEKWSKRDTKEIGGNFTMSWKKSDGTFVKAQAESRYLTSEAKPFERELVRYIEIVGNTSAKGSTFFLKQKSMTLECNLS